MREMRHRAAREGRKIRDEISSTTALHSTDTTDNKGKAEMMNEAHFNCCIVFVACFGALFLLFKILKFCRINCEGYYENPPLSQSRFHSEENTC